MPSLARPLPDPPQIRARLPLQRRPPQLPPPALEKQLKPHLLEHRLRDQVVLRAEVGRGGGQQRVHHQPEHVLHQQGDDPAQQGARGGEAGVGVELDEPGPEVVGQHEVQPQQLERVCQVLRVQSESSRLKGLPGDTFHFPEDGFEGLGPGQLIEVLLQLRVGHLVASLVPPVALVLLLDGVVGEVDHVILDVVEPELVAAGAHVALPVPVAPQPPVHRSHEHVVSDVELPAVVEQGPVQVLLDDHRPVLPHELLHHTPGLLRLPHQRNARAPIRVLPRLYYPDVFLLLVQPSQFQKPALKRKELGVVQPQHVVGLRDPLVQVEALLLEHRPQASEQLLLVPQGLSPDQVVVDALGLQLPQAHLAQDLLARSDTPGNAHHLGPQLQEHRAEGLYLRPAEQSVLVLRHLYAFLPALPTQLHKPSVLKGLTPILLLAWLITHADVCAGLALDIVFALELGPDQVGLVQTIGQLEPGPFADTGPNQLCIVACAHEHPELRLEVLKLPGVYHHTVRVVYLEQEVDVLQQSVLVQRLRKLLCYPLKTEPLLLHPDSRLLSLGAGLFHGLGAAFLPRHHLALLLADDH